MVTDDEVQEFKKLYKKKFGITLSDQEALADAIALFRMVELIYKPMTEEEYINVMKRRGLYEEPKEEIGFKPSSD